MKIHKLSVLVLLCISLFLIILSCSSQPDYKTINGPESRGISTDLKGTLLFDRPVGGLVSISLPTKDEKIIRTPGASSGSVHSISGPDHDGRIAIIENHMTENRHLLKLYQSNGKELSSIFERQGDALWGNEVGDFLALSPVKGYVALIVNAPGVQLRNPDAYLHYGNLEIWDINKKEKLPIKQGALDYGLSWFPDGKHLAFVDLIDKGEAAAVHRETTPPQNKYGQTNLKWHRVPTVSIINVDTGKVRRIFVGWRPVVSEDGKQILAGDFDNNWVIFSSTGSFIKSIDLPGLIRLGVIYFDLNKIFYWGLPTKGAELKATKNNSPLVGPKPMYTLKVAEIETGKFETVIPYIDPRRDLSFGRIKQNEGNTQPLNSADAKARAAD